MLYRERKEPHEDTDDAKRQKRDNVKLKLTILSKYSKFRDCFSPSTVIEFEYLDAESYFTEMRKFPEKLYEAENGYSMVAQICGEYISGRYDSQISFLQLKDGSSVIAQVTLGSVIDIDIDRKGSEMLKLKLEGIVKEPHNNIKGIGLQLLTKLKTALLNNIMLYVSPHPGNEGWIKILKGFEHDNPGFIEVRSAV